MSLQRTLALIKPDAVADGNVGNIIAAIEKEEFKLIALKLLHLSKSEAEGFYAVHKARPFFNDLVTFMTEGPVLAMILEKEEAIAGWRTLMGATNPEQAEEGTIRKRFGNSIQRNATHGSDAEETAAFETRYFFNATEMN